MPDARDPPGHLRHQRQPGRGRNRVQAPVLVDDEVTPGAHEGPRPAAPPPLERHPSLFRPPVHQRDPRRPEQHHPTRQDPCEGLPQHGLLQHHALPDPRQTRPQHRHHLTHFTHPKQRKAKKYISIYLSLSGTKCSVISSHLSAETISVGSNTIIAVKPVIPLTNSFPRYSQTEILFNQSKYFWKKCLTSLLISDTSTLTA